MSQWQPIETAPRDGEAFLACDWRTKDSQEVVFYYPGDNPDFIWGQTENDYRLHKDRFTHWMPLPALPTGDKP